jgi:TP901 family phage tail tape measure protein
MAVNSSSVDVRLRLRGARTFQRQVSTAGAELEAMGLKGANAMAGFAAKAKSLKSFGSSMTRSVTLPVIGLAFAAGRVDVAFDKAMRNVNSIAQLPEKQFARLEDQVTNLAGKTAQSPQVLAEGLYDLVSSGFDAAESMHILEASANAATAGLTTTDISTKAVAAVLNAYRMPASKAQLVSDQLFQTVNRGVISFEDLASNIGDVLPFAAALGVGLDQVGASIATMTKAGISPSETMTRIKAIMSSLLKPSGDLKNVIEGLGYESGEAMIKTLGFQGTLDALAKATGGSKEELAKLFPNIRALGGALALTGDNSKVASADIKGMADSGGATAKALSEQSKSIAFQWNKLKAEAQALAIQVGPGLMGALRSTVGMLQKAADWFGKLSPGMQNGVVMALLFAAALGPVIWLIGNVATAVGGALVALAWLAGGIQMAALSFELGLGPGIAFTAMLDAMGLSLLANPAFLAAAAIIGIAAAFVLAYKKVGWFHDAVDATWSWIKGHWPLLLAILAGPFGIAVKFIVDHFGSIKSAAITAWGVIKTGAAAVFGFLKAVWGPAIWAFKIGMKIVVGIFKLGWAYVKMVATSAFHGIKGVAQDAFAVIKFLAKIVWAVVSWHAKMAFKAIMILTAPMRWVVVKAFEAIKAIGGAVWGFIKDKAGPVWDWLKGAADDLKTWFTDAFRSVKDIARGVWDWLESKIKWFTDRIQGLVNMLPGGSVNFGQEITDAGYTVDGNGNLVPTGGSAPPHSGPASTGGASNPGRPRGIPKRVLTPIGGGPRGSNAGRQPIHHTTVIELDGEAVAKNTVRHLERKGARG